MPTVIDSLIVEVGLDPSKFTKGQKEAIKNYNDAKEAARKAGQEIEGMGQRSAEVLGFLQNQINKLGTAAINAFGTYGVGKLITETIKQDAASNRLAYTLETNVTTLDKWRNAAYLAGGSAEGVTGFIQGLTSEFAKWEIHGESQLIPFFRGLGVQVSDLTTGKMRPFADIMRDVSNAVQKLGPAQGAEWLRSIGADQGSINLLIKGGDELERYLKLGQKFSAVTQQGAANASKMDLALRSLNLAFGNATRAAMGWLGEKGLTEGVTATSDMLEDFSKGKFIRDDSLIGSLLGRGKFAGFGLRTSADGASSSGSAFPSKEERLAFYRAEAAKRGISPDVVEKVVRSEGLNGYIGDRGSSFGDFQLHYGGVASGGMAGKGLGDTFTKKTGLDARDNSTWKEQATFALDQMKQGGLGPWHGWKGSPWAGIDRGGGSQTTSDVKINTINIQTQATDAAGIAATIKPAIENSSLGYQGQAGPQ